MVKQSSTALATPSRETRVNAAANDLKNDRIAAPLFSKLERLREQSLKELTRSWLENKTFTDVARSQQASQASSMPLPSSLLRPRVTLAQPSSGFSEFVPPYLSGRPLDPVFVFSPRNPAAADGETLVGY